MASHTEASKSMGENRVNKHRRSPEPPPIARKRYKSIALRPTSPVAAEAALGPESESGTSAPPLSRARPLAQKASLACDTCRHKKVKCNESRPACAYCTRHRFRCTYPDQPGVINNEKLSTLLERFTRLEQSLESLKEGLPYRQPLLTETAIKSAEQISRRVSLSDSSSYDPGYRAGIPGSLSAAAAATAAAVAAASTSSGALPPQSTAATATQFYTTPPGTLPARSPDGAADTLSSPSVTSATAVGGPTSLPGTVPVSIPGPGPAPVPSSYALPHCQSTHSAPQAYPFDPKTAKYHNTTPFACEEARAPLPNLLAHEAPTATKDLLPHVEDYLRAAYSAFPIMCKTSAFEIGISVKRGGMQVDVSTCYALLMSALSKAYSQPAEACSGLADFQTASQILSRVDGDGSPNGVSSGGNSSSNNARASLNYVVVEFLSCLFLLKKGRLINFAMSLHAACSALYSFIRRGQLSCVEYTTSERNTIRSTFWVARNLERDLCYEIDDTFPQSSLYLLDDHFALPLGCDITPNMCVPPSIRNDIMLSLAEMSLRAVLARILSATDTSPTAGMILHSGNTYSGTSTNINNTTGAAFSVLSPLIPELRSQLDEWLYYLPSVLQCSVEPAKSAANSVCMARLKLLYWFARFALVRPLLIDVLNNPASPQHLHTWALFQNGMVAAAKMLKVFLWEEMDVDFLMGSRLISAMEILNAAVRMQCVPTWDGEMPETLLRSGHDLLHQTLAGRSEWIACKLYNIQIARP